jgi:hypothetical protein
MASPPSEMMTETPTPIEAEGRLEFCLRLTRAHGTLIRRLDNTLSGLHGLSFGDFMILYHLGRAPGLRLPSHRSIRPDIRVCCPPFVQTPDIVRA